MITDCIFCRIVTGDLPAKIIHRDDQVVAFADVNPQAPVHVLVIPTRHIPSLLDERAADGEILVPIFRVIRTLATDLNLEKGFRVVSNCGPEAGQTVFHVHFHLLGRRAMHWPPG